MRKEIVIWGTSGHALVVADIVRLRGHYEITGFLDDVNTYERGTEFCGVPILGGREQLDILAQQSIRHIILGFGNCEARLHLSEVVRFKGFLLATAVHPQSVIANDVSLGSGTVVVAGAVINPGCKIGENVIINTCSSVDHECVIADGVHIGPGAHLAGKVHVGRASWIGVGAVVKDKVRIGEGAIIGAGAVVVNDIPNGVIAYGVPAKVIRKNEVKA